MASILKRKEQVQELRKAHFPFGFQDNKNMRSEYQKEYLQNPIEASLSNGNKNSNFTIGSNDQAMSKFQYQSEFKQKYPQHPQQQKEAIKKSNDQNNFVLGFRDNDKSTNYNNDYGLKAAEKVKQINQRQIHIDLGDTLVDFTTSYNKFHDGVQGGKPQKIEINLAATNLILGSDKANFTTSNAASYNQKPMNPNKINSRSYGTNILLGQDNPTLHSQNKTQFMHKNNNYESVDKNRILDFRSAHFQFAFPAEKTSNLSQAQAHYYEKQIPVTKVQGNRPTNIQLKHQDNNYYESSYGENFKGQRAEKAELLGKNGRQSSVVIGMGNQTYNSQAKDQFGQKTVEKYRGKGQDGSLELGDGNRQFLTHYQQTFINKFDSHEPSALTKEEIAKLKAENLVKGFDAVNYKLHSQKYGQGRGDGSNKLPRQVIDKMRGTNIVNIDSTQNYTTTHKQAYNWKKNDDL